MSAATHEVANPTKVTTPTEREFRTERVFDAPRDLVFRAWTEKEHLAKWFGLLAKAVFGAPPFEVSYF